MNGYKGEFMMTNPKEIVIDRNYQRPQKNTLIAQIAQNPSWEAFGVPTCFRRSNGMLYCADGQQRIAGILASANPPKEVPVIVFDIQDVREEAEVFVMINEWRKALQPLEKHKSKIVAGDEAALNIEEAVVQAGFTIDNNTGRGTSHARTISAIAGVNMIYNRIGQEGLLQTLICIRDAWPDDKAALSTHILRGVAQIIEEQGENYNRTKLTNALKKTSPAKILRQAEALAFDLGGSKLTNVRRAFASEAGLKQPREPKAAVAAIR